MLLWKWLGLRVLVFEEEEEKTLGLERERSVLSVFDSKALFQNPKSISSSLVLLFQLLDVDLVFGGVIFKDKSGCTGNSSIFSRTNSLSISIYIYIHFSSFLFSSSSSSSSPISFW